MINVSLDDGEMVLVKQALEEKNWRILPTWKLHYVFQRFCNNSTLVKEVAREAWKNNRGVTHN